MSVQFNYYVDHCFSQLDLPPAKSILVLLSVIVERIKLSCQLCSCNKCFIFLNSLRIPTTVGVMTQQNGTKQHMWKTLYKYLQLSVDSELQADWLRHNDVIDTSRPNEANVTYYTTHQTEQTGCSV